MNELVHEFKKTHINSAIFARSTLYVQLIESLVFKSLSEATFYQCIHTNQSAYEYCSKLLEHKFTDFNRISDAEILYLFLEIRGGKPFFLLKVELHFVSTTCEIRRN